MQCGIGIPRDKVGAGKTTGRASERERLLALTARKEVTDVSWFSKEAGNPQREALSLSFNPGDKGIVSGTFWPLTMRRGAPSGKPSHSQT